MSNATRLSFLRSLSLACFFFLTLSIPVFPTDLIAAEQKITIVNQEQSDPAWKQRWDKARELFRQGSFESAADQYLKVVEEKPHIEEVRWELAKTYIEANSYSEALVLIEELVEAAPEKAQYQVSGGEVALAMGRAEQAAKLFGRALALAPDGDQSVRAIKGMINSLKVRDKFELAIPLMEQLYRNGERGQNLLKELARYYDSTGNARRSAYFYQELLTNYRAPVDILLEAAEAFDAAGLFTEAAEQRETLLISNPLQYDARVKLAGYYQSRGEVVKALPHMRELAEQGYRRDRYLLDLARINYDNLGRSDRALYYYEQYRSEYPSGVDVSSEIATLQLLVANDLMAIVENDGASMLWRDLGQVTEDRVGIFLAIAEKLEEKGASKKRELLEVLEVIHENYPDNVGIISRIALLYLQNKDYENCLSFLDGALQSGTDRTAILRLRIRCEAAAGLELQQLQSYISYLQIRPGDRQVRRRSIELAGSLGMIDEVRNLFSQRVVKPVSPTGKLEETFVHSLLLSGLSDEAYQFLNSVVDKGLDSRVQARIYSDLAESYMKKNRLFKAERLLRSFAARHPSDPLSYLMLAGHFIDRKDIKNTRLWLEQLQQETSTDRTTPGGLEPAHKSRLFYLQLQLDELSGRREVTQRALDYLQNRKESNQINAEDIEIVLYAARNLLNENRFKESNELLQIYTARFEDDERIDNLRIVCTHLQENGPSSVGSVPAGLSVVTGFGVVDQLVKLQWLEMAHKLSAELLERLPGSTRGTVLAAYTGYLTARYEEAFKRYEGLAKNYPEESWFNEQLLRIEILQGNPASIFTYFSVLSDDTGRKNRIDYRFDSMNYPKAKLMWARALWSDDRWEEALDVYGLLDTELKRDVDQLISIVQEHPELLSRVPRQTAESDLVPTLMSTDFISTNLSDPVNLVSVDYFEAYRWSIIVEKEVAAKSALKSREFYLAEREYQELFEEDRAMVEENYPDLATIYGRLGRLKEESQMIETIQERSIFYPGFSEVSEKSVRRQRPSLSIDAGYLQEDGRDGFKDIKEKYAGLGLQVKPTLYQEIGLRAGRSEYGDNSASTLAKSNRISGNYAIELSDNFQGDFSLGFEDFDTDGKSFLLYDVTLTASLEQKLQLYATIKQNPVDDTITSLLDGIYRRDKEFGLNLDYLFGMFFGVDLGFYDYNDGNDGQKYHLWGSYRWFGEQSSLDFTYSFLKIQNEISNTTLFDPEDGVGLTGPAYWSPDNYWKHLLSAEYKLELWPTGRLQSGTSWFSTRYGVGFEKDDNLVQEIEANIFLEIGQPFLVKGTFLTTISDDYDSLEGYISLAYRW